MKKLSTLIFLALITIITFSCTTDEAIVTSVPPTNNNPINTSDLKLFVIDTAKVNTINMMGTNEATILNRKVNSNSYIGGFSINGSASKFVYVDNQGAFTNVAFTGQKSVRIANANGTADTSIYTAPTNTNTTSTDIGFVKFGTSKIYFSTTTQTFVGGAVSNLTKINSTNLDGTGLVAENYVGNPQEVYKSDITNDGRYLTSFQSAPSIPKLLIFDRTGDNGAGTVVYQETLTAESAAGSGAIFSYDNKFAYFAYAENQSLKVRIVNMTTFTAETKTIATAFTPTTFAMSMSVGSDNNRGVLTVQTFGNNNPSKSYIFNLSASSSSNFNNNDENISMLKAF